MSEIKFKIPLSVYNPVYRPLLDCKKRYLVFYGGSGSGKSYFIAERYIRKMLKEPLCNLLVVRETGKSNRDSTYALLKQIINKWGLHKYFIPNESDLRIRCTLNGNEIIFGGLDDVEKLKSTTFSRGDLTDIWMEEASETLESDFNQLDLRLRGKNATHQIVLSFNPVDINHWLKKRFFDTKNDNAEVLHTTYLDNNFVDEDYKRLLESYKTSDPYYYSVYCLGQWGTLGKTIFDQEKVQERINTIKKPIKVGYFIYDYDDGMPQDKKIQNIKWINDPDGYIKIYDVPNIYKYVIGGDTAGEGSDYFTAQVLNARTGEQVATLKQQFDEDVYAKQIYCLGKYYADALVSIECNFSSYPIKELERLGYTNMYVREKEDTYTGSIEKSYGFRTTSITRPVIIAELVKIVRESTDLLNDKETLEEMLTFVRNEKGRPEAQIGTHDDLIMGLAIAYRSREQVILDDETIIVPRERNFSFEDVEDNGYGKIEVI